MRVLLIDEDKVFTEQFSLYAALSGWEFEVLNGQSTEKLSSILSDLKPEIVILDYQLDGSLSFEHWRAAIRKADYTKIILFLNGNDEPKKFKDKHFQVVKKPFELSTLTDYLAVSGTAESPPAPAKRTLQQEKTQLYKAIQQLPLALSVHYISPNSGQYAEPDWHNEAYKKHPLDDVGKQHFMSLVYTAQAAGEDSGHRTDWDEGEKKWLHLRLYKLPDNRYWFAREWGTEDSTPNFFHAAKGLREFLEGLKLSLRNWGITRLRFYHLHEFYDDTATEVKRDGLLAPYYQHGDGFTTGVTEQDWLEHWFHKKNSQDAEHLFNLAPEAWHIKGSRKDNKNNECHPQPACHQRGWHEATSPCRARGPCSEIGWGELGVDRIEVPIFGKREDGTRRALGLLAFDRRYDHIDGVDNQKDYAWLKAYIDRAGGGNSFSEISDQELASMRPFMLKAIDELSERCEQLRRDQLRTLHEEISGGIKKVTEPNQESAEKFSPSAVLKGMLKNLIEQWESIDQYDSENSEVIQILKLTDKKGILSWYFVKQEEMGSLRGLGGYGGIAEALKDQLFAQTELSRKTFAVLGTPKSAYVVQDFQSWLSAHRADWLPATMVDEEDAKWIKSWIGVPLEIADQRYLMVVHAGRSNYFTTRRTKLLKSVALRMRPFLLWLVAEETRTWFYRSLSHELRSPLDAALQYAKLVPDGKELPHYLRYVHSLIENVWHLSHPDALVQQGETETTLKNVWDIVPMLQTLHLSIKIEIEHGFDTLPLAVPSAVLRQVLFNLVGNACKFAYSGSSMPVQIKLEKKGNELNCRIRNPIQENEKMSADQLNMIFNAGYRAPNAGSAAGSGIGLAVVSSLCQQVGMKCVPELASYENGAWYQTFCLTMPITGVSA